MSAPAKYSKSFTLTIWPAKLKIMNQRFYQMAIRSGRFFSAKTRSKPTHIGDFSGISPAWRPFGPIAGDVLGTRFTDEFDDESCKRLARTVDEAPMDCKESLKDFHIQINLPGT